MNKTYLTLVSLLAGVCSAHASIQYTSTSFNADNGVYATVVSNDLSLLPNGGGYSAIGIFAMDPAGLPTPALLASQFTAFASGAFGGVDALDATGSYSVGANIGNPTAVAVPGGQAVYLVFGNGANLLTSTEFAVVNTGLVNPANPADPGIVAFTTDLVAGLASGTVVHGSIVALVPSPNLEGVLGRGNSSLRLAVPEPGVGVLSFASIALLVARRRRRA